MGAAKRRRELGLVPNPSEISIGEIKSSANLQQLNLSALGIPDQGVVYKFSIRQGSVEAEGLAFPSVEMSGRIVVAAVCLDGSNPREIKALFYRRINEVRELVAQRFQQFLPTAEVTIHLSSDC